VLLTTQYLAEAEQLADQVAVLHQGRIVAEGTASQLKSGLGAGSLDEAFLALTAPDDTAPDDTAPGDTAPVRRAAADRIPTTPRS